MKKINFDKLAKIIILIGFSVFYLKILISKEILLYVHPRIIPFAIFSTFFMIITAIFLITSLYTSYKRTFKIKKYIAFIIPLILIFLISTLKSDARTLDINANSTSNSKSNTVSSSNNNEYAPDLYSGKTASYGDGTISNPKLDISNNIIKVSSKNFVSSLDEIISNCAKYEGNSIEITGFIYNDKNLNLTNNQFIIARYMMVCCAADMQIAGLRCQYINIENSLDLNTWVKISGKIKNDSYESNPDPLILIDKIEIDSNPDTSYVYPY
ncbi:TIGR03943 family protein [Clostridium butyricum]|uniref:TIGR03943 family protein n=1 Tax=Clostridium butyricum TaxID=1492 RepID=A0A512TK49_CLOBU|nr:TIGR03943 family protein [Clostridium butyricum]NAS19238.1 TIGR03943 family protein [Clostridium butyricum]NOW25082.1 putative membrane protein [Clostridium butyricum]RQN10889.1 TIGR03943 family protein [Clostridium butyricum]GEQ20606.1 TIGR03943 family protein [Clostridium butyricum]